MGVFSVPVSIGVDEEAIAKKIEENVESQVVRKIAEEIESIIYVKQTGTYYHTDKERKRPLYEIIEAITSDIMKEKEDEIIKLAVDGLVERLLRKKMVKEYLADEIKKAKA